ncbi:Hypothetical predicted protein, partial [Paramuricea clavata]
MAWNNGHTIEQNLQRCYELDFDWDLIPHKLQHVCEIFGKRMKQQKTTVLFALLTAVSFVLGHASVTVKDGWEEPVVVWLAVVLKTGRCKSALHHFLENLIEKVHNNVPSATKGENGISLSPGTMLLPHCTWEKFGDILANNGGRIYGLFDELVSFFSTMNMYSSSKSTVQDNREYQDFLKMFTGKAKNRETITGNANFNMRQTSFTLLGFTQPQTALPIIHNAKGFTSRILWYFPNPIFRRLADSELTEDEKDACEQWEQNLVEFLTNLYIDGEKTFSKTEVGKIVDVKVEREQYIFSPEAKSLFAQIHDNWEMNVCKKFQSDVLLS